MTQVTIYLDGQTEEQMDRAAKDAGMSRSRWVAELIREKTSLEWPDWRIEGLEVIEYRQAVGI